MIELKNVNKYFNKGKRNQIHVINNANVTLPDNGLVALLGESGSGKTTLLNAIGGLDRINKGKIYINGKKVSKSSTHKIDKIRNLHIGYIFQDYKLLDDLTVYDNVALSLKLVGIKDKKEIKERVEYVLDKVGILRYRYRPCSTLSGGERQRVGIARALVKNPDIILADEPTGNLDSRNSVEVMNIIKRISKDRLVILVTHERPLAEFYASRIIEVKDGVMVSDKDNDNTNDLEYEIANTFYLKDFSDKVHVEEEDRIIDIYSDTKEKLNINLIVKNGNIYIQSKDGRKIEVVDDNSMIEVIDDHKKPIDKNELDNYDFDMSHVGNQKLRRRYSLTFNPFSALKLGFKKLFSFPVLKKILLIGFIFAGIFMVYSLGKICAIFNVEDKDFIQYNKDYVLLEKRGVDVEEYNELKTMDGVNFVLPGDSLVSMKFKMDDYYQTLGAQIYLSLSLSDASSVDSSEILLGRMPENSKEVVLDKLSVQKLLDDEMEVQMCGILTMEDFLNRKLYLGSDDMYYTIVGIIDRESPSMYVDSSEFVTIIKYHNNSNYTSEVTNYLLSDKEFTLTKNSKLPENDYEVLLPESYSYDYKLGKQTSIKINDKSLTVVGFYTNTDITGYYVNENTTLYELIGASDTFTISSDSKDVVVSTLNDRGMVAYDTYLKSESEYETNRRDSVRQALIICMIFIGISLIEIYLMTRSSFLSRVKEIGTLRAIGVKKFDIYQMFIGEIVAIVTMTVMPAMILMYKAESFLVEKISYFGESFYMPLPILILAIIFMYIFNIVIGCLPIFTTMLKSPAKILSRYDVD